MKVIIAGTRDLDIDYIEFKNIINSLNLEISEVVSGNSGVIDLFGERYSKEELCKNPKLFPANWRLYKKSAGPIRNGEMAQYADFLILIWNGKSSGSLNMKSTMIKLNKPYKEVILNKPSTSEGFGLS